MYLNKNVVFYATDFKEAAVTRYKDFSNVIWYEPKLESLLNMFNDIKMEFNRRKELFRAAKVETFLEYNELEGVEKLPFIIIITDEANGYKRFKPKDNEELEDLRWNLVREVRSTGMSFIEAVQRNIDDVYSKSIRTQMDLKLIHKVERSDIGNCCGDEEQKELIKVLERGDFVMNYNDSVYDSFRSPFAKPSDEILKMLKETYEDEK
jgi:DNA segregation ATPase FtsK/SpoIIIE-like protein